MVSERGAGGWGSRWPLGWVLTVEMTELVVMQSAGDIGAWEQAEEYRVLMRGWTLVYHTLGTVPGFLFNP